jgi:ABC-type multidrug transport system fused ATPase/permease subunit
MPSPDLKLTVPAAVEEPAVQGGVFAVLYRFSPGQRRMFVIALVMLVCEAIAGVFQPYPIGYVVDYLNGKRPPIGLPWHVSPQIGTIAVLTGGLILLAALRSLCDSLAEVFLARAGRRLGYRIRVTLYAHLQRLSLAFHSRRQTGEMLRRVTSDIEQVETFIIASLSDIAGAILVLLGTIVFLLYRSWEVALLAAVLVPVLSLISHFFSRRITATSRRQRAREADLSSAAQEMLTSIPVVQTFGQNAYEQERFAEGSRSAMAAALESVGLQARFSWVIGVLEAVSTSAVIWLGIWLVDRRALSIGTLILFIIQIQNMFRPTRKIIKQWALVGKVRASVERVADVLARRPSVRDLPGAERAPTFRGDLEFRNVSFAYQLEPEDSQGEAQARSVLEGVSFRVPSGDVVALVGPSGAGKSTIAQLIPRLYDPQAGEVRIDGRDIRKFTLDSLRRQISLVLQDTILFRGSVAHNIGYGRSGATRAEIVAAAKRANAHEFIERMPHGYDTELSERATNLSGGQRQRIAIARAVVRAAPILILDEPTTGLDAESAQMVLKGLHELMQGKTTLIISHDLSLIQRADRILVIRQGRVEESGTHGELMRGGGVYASMHALRSVDPEAIVSPPGRRAEIR